MELLMLTAERHADAVLPSLSLLVHNVRTAPPEVSSLLEAGTAEVLIVDARNDLPAARGCAACWAPPGARFPWWQW